MTSSNEKTNLTGDQADDLIAELARIVADDAQQTNVAQAIDERAEANVNAPMPEDAVDNIAPFPTPEEVREPAYERSPVEDPFAGGFDLSSEPTRELTEATSVPQEAPATEEAQLTAEPVPTDIAGGFEFDFSESIKNGPTSDLQAEQEFAGFRPEPISTAENVGTFAQAAQEIASPEETQSSPGPEELDGIASLIEQVEAQVAEPEAPAFDPVPVPTAAVNEPQQFTASYETPVEVDAQPADEAAETAFSEDAFAEPPSIEPEQFEQNEVVQDALTEIENLIADTKPPAVEQPTGKAPADAAEAAIMAALGAARSASGHTGAAVSAARASNQSNSSGEAIQTEAPTARDRVEVSPQTALHSHAAQAPSEPKVDVRESAQEERRGGMLPVFGAVAAVLLLAVVGGVAYWMFSGQSGTSEVPVVAAQNTEVKLTPEPVENTEPESSVFSALEGNSENPTNEQIVSRDETSTGDTASAPRVITPTGDSNGLTNRKVKTVTVLADGTIVTGEEASAGAEQLPQEVRPNVPEVSSDTATAPTDEITNVLNSIVEDTTAPVAEAVDNAATQVAALTDAVTSPETSTPVENTEATSVDATAPTPPTRPAGLGTNQPLASAVLATPQPSASTSQTEQPISLLPSANSQASSSTSTGVSAPFYVQLSSQRSQEAAQATATTLSRQYSSVLGNSTLDINRVNLGDRGIYYRVRVPASSLADANAICSNLKASGGDCFVRSN